MKKVILSMLAIAAFSFTSCSNDEEFDAQSLHTQEIADDTELFEKDDDTTSVNENEPIVVKPRD